MRYKIQEESKRKAAGAFEIAGSGKLLAVRACRNEVESKHPILLKNPSRPESVRVRA